MVAAYLVAVEDYEPDIVEVAVNRLFKGVGRTGNVAFAPSPTEVSLAAKAVFHERLDEQHRRQRLQEMRLPAPEPVQRSPEEMARIDALLASYRRDTADINPKAYRMRPHEITRAQAEAELEAKRKNPRKITEVSESLRNSLFKSKT